MRQAVQYLALLHLMAMAAYAQQVPEMVVAVQAIWSNPQAHAGDQRTLAVVLDIHPSYHINPDASRLHDDLLIPTQLKVITAADGMATTPVRYPKPTPVEIGPIDNPRLVDAYEGRVVLYLPVTITSAVQPGDLSLELELIYQACDRHVCLAPVTLSLRSTLTVVDGTTPIPPPAHPDQFSDFDATTIEGATPRPVTFDAFGLSFDITPTGLLGTIILLGIAAIGGLLLNFTPCVLPVIPLKMMGLSQAATDRTRCLLLGVSMSLGVVAFWLGLGVAIAAVSGFTATNQLFQYPAFTTMVGATIAVMAMGMIGLFTVRVPKAVYAIDPRRDTLTGSFLLGVLTAILSTPCTAPFMGAAAAWAATQESATTLATFVAIGAGMALPYFLLAAFPQWIQSMPRTGPASVLVKQTLGLLLLAVAAYFFGVGLTGLSVSPPDPPSLLYWWPVMAAVAAAGVWLAYRTLYLTQSNGKRAALIGLGVSLLVGAVYGGVRLTHKGPIDWVYYTPARFTDAQNSGRIVVIDFTAEWCLNCKWLEKNVLQQPAVVERLNRNDIAPMKVDLTGHNPDGSRLLERVGRVAIPLLVVYAPDGSEVFKSDAYTASQVLDAIAQAR